MAKLKVRSLDNVSAGELEISSALADTPFQPYIIKDAVVQYRSKVRAGTHSTKGRSEVSGSSRKPWRQKGTGRARSGTAKSPVWRHGGTTFGPKPRSHSISLNKKVRRKALQSAIAEKIRQEQLVVIDSLELKSHKTKEFRGILDTLECQSALIVTDEIQENLHLAARNLPNVHVLSYRSLNTYEMLRFPKVIFTKDALTALEKRLLS